MNIQFLENADLDCLLPILWFLRLPLSCAKMKLPFQKTMVDSNLGQTTMLKVESDVCLHQETVDPHIIS